MIGQKTKYEQPRVLAVLFWELFVYCAIFSTPSYPSCATQRACGWIYLLRQSRRKKVWKCVTGWVPETYIVPNLALHNINLVRFFVGPEQYQFCPLFLREMQIYSLRDLPCSLSAKLAGNLSHPSLSCPILHTSLPNFLVEAVILRRLSNHIEWRLMPIDIIRIQSS